jgi:hypothetical protein
MPKFVSSRPPFSEEALATRSTILASNLAVPAASAGAASTGAASAGATSAGAASLGATSAVGNRAAISLAASSQLVEVSDVLAAATILRAGKEVTAPTFNAAKMADFLGHTQPVPHGLQPVTVSQSIPPGTRVAKGTPVDLVLLAASEIPFGLFDKAHADLAGKVVTDVLPILSDPQVGPLLDKGSAAALSEQEKTTLKTALAAKGITVSDTDATRSLDLAFSSLAGARAFQ